MVQEGLPTNWYLTLDLHGAPEDYPELFAFLEGLGAKQISKSIWWFEDADTSKFSAYCKQLIPLVMQASPNQPALRDAFSLVVGGKHFICSSEENLVRAGLTSPGSVGKQGLSHRVYSGIEEVFTLVSDLPA
jgi:hypothetical protein